MIFHRNSNLMVNFELFDTIVGYHMATKFRSTVVVPCAKFFSDHFTITWMTAEWNFHRIWITMEKPSWYCLLYYVIDSRHVFPYWDIHASPWWRHQMESFSTLLAICAGNSPHIGQWRGVLMFSLIYVWINGWVNNGEAGDLRRYRTHYDVTVIPTPNTVSTAYKSHLLMHRKDIWFGISKIYFDIPY